MTEEKRISWRSVGASGVFSSQSVAAIVAGSTGRRHREKFPIFSGKEATGQ
jgi:hypothetical protein